MSDQAAIGHGSKFLRSDDGLETGTFVAVAGIMNITAPGLSRDVVDSSDMDSLERWREYISGMRDAGEVSLDVEFNPNGASVTDWLADINSDVRRFYRITFPDDTSWTFAGFITAFEPEAPNEDKMTASVTYKLTGKPGFIA